MCSRWNQMELCIALNPQLHFFFFLAGGGGFTDSSVGKESACLQCWRPWFHSWIRKIQEEEIGYPLQDSWASLVAQLVKNLPATWETWVWSLGWEDPLEKGKPTHSSILDWRILQWTTLTFSFLSAAFLGWEMAKEMGVALLVELEAINTFWIGETIWKNESSLDNQCIPREVY